MKTRKDSLIERVSRTIGIHHMFRTGDQVLVGVSGGADSVALLHVLVRLAKDLKIRITAAHLDHGIRGKSAQGDSAFTVSLARKLRVKCIAGKADVPRLADESGESIEMAARGARYRFFAESAHESGATVVATAHNADDVAETIILNLCRGSGPRGLAGIPYHSEIRGMRVVRPLLDATRPEIERFLRDMGQTWREDETNDDPVHLRNRVRHEVLPFLETRLNPALRQTLVRTGEVLRAEEDWLDGIAAGILLRCRCSDHHGISADRLTKNHIAARRRVIRLWLAGEGISSEFLDFDCIDRVNRLAVRKRTGSRTVVAGSTWTVVCRYGELSLERSEEPGIKPFRATLKVPGDTILPARGIRVTAKIGKGILRPPRQSPVKLPASVSLDVDAVVRRKLVLRSWRPGDRMEPFGMGGSKKLQDIFTDLKLPREQRGRVPVLECGGRIAWLPGYSVARTFAVKPGAAKALHITLDRK